MTEKLCEEVIERLKKMPPLSFAKQCCKIYKDNSNLVDEHGLPRLDSITTLMQTKNAGSIFDRVVNENDSCTVFELEKDLLELLADTESTEFVYRPLPYPAVFINNDIMLGGTLHRGLLAVDVNQIELDEFPKLKDTLVLISFDINKQNLSFSIMSLDNLDFDSDFKKDSSYVHKSKSQRNLAFKNIIGFFNNLLWTLSYKNDDIEFIEYDHRESNKKREKRGKYPRPDFVKYLRLGGKTRIYTKAYLEAKNSLEYQSFVKGFFRHYRSDRYVNKQGDVDWIMPHIRGADLPERPEIRLVKISATDKLKEELAEK